MQFEMRQASPNDDHCKHPARHHSHDVRWYTVIYLVREDRNMVLSLSGIIIGSQSSLESKRQQQMSYWEVSSCCQQIQHSLQITLGLSTLHYKRVFIKKKA